ncbi:MAG: hypothetical protein AAFQ95_19740 [Cyanobacteria bacterium J06621_3]
MKDTKSRTSTKSIKEGWSIHVYDQERHLRCTIEPSHIRALGLGIVFGMFLTVVITNIDLPVKFVSSPAQSRSVEQNELPAMIQVD